MTHLQRLLIRKAVVGDQRDQVASCIFEEKRGKAELIDKLIEARVPPPPAKDVIFMPDGWLRFDYNLACNHEENERGDTDSNEHECDSSDSTDNSNDDSDWVVNNEGDGFGKGDAGGDNNEEDRTHINEHELDMTVSDDENDPAQHMGWRTPFQIFWDTPPTCNRKKSEMVCFIFFHPSVVTRANKCVYVAPQAEPDHVAIFAYDSLDAFRSQFRDKIARCPNPLFDETRG